MPSSMMASVPAAKRAITRISVERQLLQMFKSGLTGDDLSDVLDTAEIKTVSAGQPILTEGEEVVQKSEAVAGREQAHLSSRQRGARLRKAITSA